jgi:hypothetical protein
MSVVRLIRCSMLETPSPSVDGILGINAGCHDDRALDILKTRTPRCESKGVQGMATLLIALGFFILIAILGPLVGADSRVPGGWTSIEPGGKLWPGPR